MLQDEVQTPAPHLCARHISTFKVYNTLAQVASEYYEEPITYETLDIFKILIESEEVDFLEDKGFADALIGFISKISTMGPVMVSIDTEGRIVEVLFGVASKLRLQPKLLPAWFRPVIQDASRTNSKADKEVFPLFYLTLDYVHHDGRVGDFARTGLLYIIESATHSEALEKWVVESDLATLMASGLGALYSQLSRYSTLLVLSFLDRPQLTDPGSSFYHSPENLCLQFYPSPKPLGHRLPQMRSRQPRQIFKHISQPFSLISFFGRIS